jgi:hypothetical protein
LLCNIFRSSCHYCLWLIISSQEGYKL